MIYADLHINLRNCQHTKSVYNSYWENMLQILQNDSSKKTRSRTYDICLTDRYTYEWICTLNIDDLSHVFAKYDFITITQGKSVDKKNWPRSNSPIASTQQDLTKDQIWWVLWLLRNGLKCHSLKSKYLMLSLLSTRFGPLRLNSYKDKEL